MRPPDSSLAPAPLSDSSPSKRVVPAPVWVPASQVEGPATTTLPAPPSVPPLCASAAIVEAPFSASVPPEMPMLVALAKALATVRLPPLTASTSSPLMARLLIVLVPVR